MNDELVPIEEIQPGSLIESEEGVVMVQEIATLDTRPNRPLSVVLATQLAGPRDCAYLKQYGYNRFKKKAYKVIDNGALLEEMKVQFLRGRFARGTFTTGCDPEIFVVDKDDKVIPAWKFLPEEANSLGLSNIPCYWDGAQAEFSPPGQPCLERLVDSIRVGLEKVLNQALFVDPKAKLTTKNVVEIPETIRKGSDIKYIRFRCTPSYNVYDDPGGGIPDAIEYPWRCAGGHIHIGSFRKWSAPCIKQGVEALDGILGVLGVSLAENIDDPERRKTYGRAGEFRLPKHGIEYRVLSNFWLVHPAIAHFTLEIARAAFNFGINGLYKLHWKADQEAVRDVINYCDIVGARRMIKANKTLLLKLLESHILAHADTGCENQTPNMEYTEAALTKPVESLVGMDIEENWMLNSFAWGELCHTEGTTWGSLSNL